MEKTPSLAASRKPAGAALVKAPDENGPYELIEACSMLFHGLNGKYRPYRRVPGR